jgi:hypothetical protein
MLRRTASAPGSKHLQWKFTPGRLCDANAATSAAMPEIRLCSKKQKDHENARETNTRGI